MRHGIVADSGFIWTTWASLTSAFKTRITSLLNIVPLMLHLHVGCFQCSSFFPTENIEVQHKLDLSLKYKPTKECIREVVHRTHCRLAFFFFHQFALVHCHKLFLQQMVLVCYMYVISNFHFLSYYFCSCSRSTTFLTTVSVKK